VALMPSALLLSPGVIVDDTISRHQVARSRATSQLIGNRPRAGVAHIRVSSSAIAPSTRQAARRYAFLHIWRFAWECLLGLWWFVSLVGCGRPLSLLNMEQQVRVLAVSRGRAAWFVLPCCS
jgi:hypothetical protein